MSAPAKPAAGAAQPLDLLPCPHCGGYATVCATGHGYWKWKIACGNCYCSTDAYADGHETTMQADWNRRAPAPASVEPVKKPCPVVRVRSRDEARRIVFADIYGVTQE